MAGRVHKPMPAYEIAPSMINPQRALTDGQAIVTDYNLTRKSLGEGNKDLRDITL